ncbi:MAG: poly(R)-hydroxyalkanoic acid synthase subunit PhaE, partial [Acidiferrobacterales bacterium]
EGKTLTTARELYDVWVDCCEDVYGDYVATDEYAELHARLVNTLMALKRHAGAIIDEVLGAMNMPTRREVNTLHHRLQQMRREGNAMRTESAALKEQVELAIRGGATSVKPQATAKAAATTRRKKPKTQVRRQSSGESTAKGE